MRVVICDIDGVLVTPEFPKGSPSCVAELNRILDVTNARIVVSSTWRLAGLTKLGKSLRDMGVRPVIAGITPDLSWSKNRLHESAPRGAEIAKWLKGHPTVEAFTILDDDADMDGLLSYLVRTDPRVGLTRKLADAAIYVDPLHDWGWKRGPSCHMMSDSADPAELHELALKIGLRRSWCHKDHYDLTGSKRLLALKHGAVECGFEKMVEIRRAALAPKIPPALKVGSDILSELRLYLFECVVCGVDHHCPKCDSVLTSLQLCLTCGVRYTHDDLGIHLPT